MIRGNTEAETCRLNGWSVGTLLVGDEGFGPETICITAIGQEKILAKRIINHEGLAVDGYETTWTLKLREWRQVPQNRVDTPETTDLT